MRPTHTIGPVALATVLGRDVDDDVRRIAAGLGTAFAVLEPGVGRFAMAYAVGQMAHESGRFRWRREIWGPTAVQAGYWRRRDLQGAGVLFPALGHRYRGGGWIQTTGRQNFRSAAAILRDAGIRAPSARWLAEHSSDLVYCSLLAAAWWAPRFPRDMSGAGWNVELVSRIVNGKHPANGLAERRLFTARAMKVREHLKPRPL